MMQIHVKCVPDEGLREHATYDPSALDMERPGDVVLPQPFEVNAFIQRADQELVVDAQMRCPLQLTCVRCLETFTETVTPRSTFTYHVRPTDVVDITEDVRQEIILAYPLVPVCRPDCKGLCAECGQNLNAAACRHAAGETPNENRGCS